MSLEHTKEIRQILIENIDEKTKSGSPRYFKEGEEALVHGVGMGKVSKIIKEYFKEIKDKSKAEIFSICDDLWQTGYLEESVIACGFAYELRTQYEPDDLKTFHRWLKDSVSNWADCDTLCNHTIGTFIEMYPQCIVELKKWAKSANRWERRGAAVTLIIPARKGLFLKDIFEIADILLLDKDDLVQKGYGWMLKAASESHQKEVFDYVVTRKTEMPRTALRYAIEKMPADLRTEAMKK